MPDLPIEYIPDLIELTEDLAWVLRLAQRNPAYGVNDFQRIYTALIAALREL